MTAVCLLITGLQMHHAYGPVAACHPAGNGICQQAAGDFLNTYAPGVGPVLGLLQVVPALTGAFVAAPVLARELETGTFRCAWTQGFGRGRWTVAGGRWPVDGGRWTVGKLMPLALSLLLLAGGVWAVRHRAA